jgi:hypothetical protein
MSGSSSTTSTLSPAARRRRRGRGRGEAVGDGRGRRGRHGAGAGRAGRRGVAPRGEAALDLGDDHLGGHRVVPAARHDHVGVALARLDELQVHRPHGGQVLLEDLVERAPAVRHVAPQPAHEAHVGVGVDVDLHVAHLAHARVDEEQDAVDHHHVGRRHVTVPAARTCSTKS